MPRLPLILLRLLAGIVLVYVLLFTTIRLADGLSHIKWNAAYLFLRLLPEVIGLVAASLSGLHLLGLYKIRLARWYAYRTMLLLLLFYAIFFQTLLIAYDWAGWSAGRQLWQVSLPAALLLGSSIGCFYQVARKNSPF